MNINVRGHKLLGALLLGVCLLVSTSSSALCRSGCDGWGPGYGYYPGYNTGWFGGGLYVGGPAYYRPYYNCGITGGYWRHGYWVPARKVCW